MASNNDSMLEGLKRLLTPISQLKIEPDADPDFLHALEQMIVQYIKSAGQASSQAALGQGGGMGAQQMGGDPTMGMSTLSPPPGPNQMAPGGMSGGGMGGLTSPSSMNPDELRRILSGAAGPG